MINRMVQKCVWVSLVSSIVLITSTACNPVSPPADGPAESVAAAEGKVNSSASQASAWVDEKEAASPDKTVRIMTLVGERFAPSLEVSGKTLAVRESFLSLGVPGLIKQITVKRGDRVKKGQVLLRLDNKGFVLGVAGAQAAAAGANANLDQLATEIDRVNQLLAEGAAPSATLDDLNAKNKGAKAQADMAVAALGQSKKALKDSVLKAPYNGVISDILKEVGEQAPAMPPTMLMKIVDASTLEVQVFVPEESSRFVRVGGSSEVMIDSAGITQKGEIVFVSDSISQGARTFETRVQIDNSDLRIKAGSFARVRFTQEAQDEAILIPISVVKRDGADLPYVFVEEAGLAEKRGIALGVMAGTRVMVLTGLSAGDRLIVSDASGIVDGQRVGVEK